MGRIRSMLAAAAIAAMTGGAVAGSAGHAVAQSYRGDSLPDEIEFRNATGEPIEEVRISPQVDEAWGGDRLRGRVIMPGETVQLPVEDLRGDCYFDVRIGGTSGADTDYFGLNLCNRPVVEAR